MTRISKSMVRLQKAYHRRDLLTQLVDRDVPINSVAAVCKQACRGLSTHKEITMRKTIMKWRLNDAHVELNTARRVHTQSRREMEAILRGEGIIRDFDAARDRERARIRGNLNIKRKRKVRFLTEKWRVNRPAKEL